MGSQSQLNSLHGNWKTTNFVATLKGNEIGDA